MLYVLVYLMAWGVEVMLKVCVITKVSGFMPNSSLFVLPTGQSNHSRLNALRVNKKYKHFLKLIK